MEVTNYIAVCKTDFWSIPKIMHAMGCFFSVTPLIDYPACFKVLAVACTNLSGIVPNMVMRSVNQ